MENEKNTEYVFWLDFWRKKSGLWPKSGHFKCVITREKIRILSIGNDPDKDLIIDISSIQRCRLGYTGNNNRHVVLSIGGGGFLLGPVHPFDPRGIRNFNHSETSALLKVVEAFRSNTDPRLDPNPYLRQLTEKNNRDGFRVPDIKWDKHTSPWAYYDLYGDKFMRLKVLSRNIALTILFAVIGVILVLGIAYVLDILNMI